MHTVPHVLSPHIFIVSKVYSDSTSDTVWKVVKANSSSGKDKLFIYLWMTTLRRAIWYFGTFLFYS